jgi:hypothetical protein
LRGRRRCPHADLKLTLLLLLLLLLLLWLRLRDARRRSDRGSSGRRRRIASSGLGLGSHESAEDALLPAGLLDLSFAGLRRLHSEELKLR